MTNKLFVAGFPYEITDEKLGEHFKTAGNVLSAKVIVDRMSGRSKGFGFVEMATVEEAEKAINQLNNTTLGNRTLIVRESKPQV